MAWYGESARHAAAARKKKRSVYRTAQAKISRRRKWDYHAHEWQKAKRRGNTEARRYHRKQMVKYAAGRRGIYKVKWKR